MENIAFAKLSSAIRSDCAKVVQSAGFIYIG